jgi:hypothetical protein
MREGKHYFSALCAVERKLVHLIYAVWKRGTHLCGDRKQKHPENFLRLWIKSLDPYIRSSFDRGSDTLP